jgi:glycosyltransferase involved in cell wall biosynthesis
MSSVQTDCNDSGQRLSAPPRLLHIFNRYLSPGGEEFAVREFAARLAEEGIFEECIFESADWKGDRAPPSWKQAALMFYNPASIHKLRQVQERVRAQAWVIHNIFPVGSAGIYSEALRQGIPLIQIIHNFRPRSVTGYLWAGRQLDAKSWPRNYLAEIRCGAWQGSRTKTGILACVLAYMHARGFFRGVKNWVAISEYMRQQFIAWGIPPDRIFRLYYSWTVKNESPNFPDGNDFVFLGRLIDAKGIKALLAAWDILFQRMGAQTPRLIIGGDGPLAECVKAAAARNARIEYRGFISGGDKHLLMAQCRAVIQPAIWAEPLSLVIYEAFDYGKPVLVAASGGMPELVRSGGGFIHQTGASAQLAEQVLQMEHLSSNDRRQMGQAGRRWLLTNTDGAQWKQQFREIVRKTISS